MSYCKTSGSQKQKNTALTIGLTLRPRTLPHLTFELKEQQKGVSMIVKLYLFTKLASSQKQRGHGFYPVGLGLTRPRILGIWHSTYTTDRKGSL